MSNKPKISAKEKHIAYKFLKLRGTVHHLDAVSYLQKQLDGTGRLDAVCQWLWYYHQVRFV